MTDTATGICTASLLTDPMAATEADVRVAARAAAEAGFASASVWAHHLPGLAGSGLRVAVVEAAVGWANGDGAQSEAEARHLADTAARHSAPLIGAACIEASMADPARAQDNLSRLVDAAVGAGARVCVEFLPGTGIPDLATAWSLVKDLSPDATILFDTWHWTRQRGGPDFDLLATIPGERVAYLQLCDTAATPGPDVMAETMTARLLPGEGTADFAAVFAALDRIGATPYTATEVFNPGLVQRLGPVGAARAMRDAAERVRPGG